MDASIPTKAICFGDAKQAALFYDRVLPLTLNDILPSSIIRYGLKELTGDDAHKAERTLVDLVGSSGKSLLFELLPRLQSFYLHGEQYGLIHGPFSEFVEEHYRKNAQVKHIPVRDPLLATITRNGFVNAPVFVNGASCGYQGPLEDKELSIYGFPLLETDQTHWDQILEIRKDKESLKKLRNLSNFFFENYHGKDQAYIERNLQIRLEEYRRAIDKHGFKTITGEISILLKENSILSYGIASLLAAAVHGAPVEALGAGAVLNTAGLILYYRERKHEFRDWKANHELAYLVDTEAKLPH